MASSSILQRFPISSYKEYFALQSQSRLDFAVLNTPTTKALQALSDLSLLRFEAILVHGDLSKHSEQWESTKKEAGISVSINIYGPRDTAAEVGRRLSKAKTYLQHPRHLDSHIEYDNPHYFALPGRPMRSSLSSSAVLLQKNIEQLRIVDVAQVLEDPEHDKGLLHQIADCHIRTSLLEYVSKILSTSLKNINGSVFSARHQQRGLHFITQRERENANDKFSLWKLHQSQHHQ